MEIPLIAFFISALAAAFILTALAARILIPKLKSIKMGLKILEIGPRWHKSKEGTPTMGGLSFLAATTVVFAAFLVAAYATGADFDYLKFVVTFVMAVLNSFIGMLDDYVKFIKKRNEGLSARQKYLAQLIVAGAYLYVMKMSGWITTAARIPFTEISLELGWFYYVFALIMITGIINCANLTDGVDGLASTVTLIVGGFFAAASFTLGSSSGAVLSAMLMGACLGFLVYNFYPAKLFMGDTGSLFLGALAVGLAFIIDNPLIIVLAGIIYVAEGVSVILQVAYFKLTGGKRLFKMSPIHHHFEKSGWSELKIVGTFSLVTLAACVAAYFGVL